MKRGRLLGILAFGAAALMIGGCGSGASSPSSLASDEAVSVPATPARQRGLMFASDNLGRAVFADGTSAVASVPDRD